MDKTILIANYLGLNNIKIQHLKEYEQSENREQILYEYNLIKYYLGATFENEQYIFSHTKKYHGKFFKSSKFNLYNLGEKIVVLYPDSKVLKKILINIKLIQVWRRYV